MRPENLTKKKFKKTKDNVNWNRVEELLAEKLADRVKIKLNVRESEEDVEDDMVMEEEYDSDDIDAELSSQELSFFFINKFLNNTNKVN